MRFFAITHIHEFGSSFSHVRCEGDFSGQFYALPDDDDSRAVFLRESVGLNFEPNAGDEVYVTEFYPDAAHLVVL